MVIRFIIIITLLLKLGKSEYKRVCYYTNWSQYRRGDGKFLPSNIDPFLCTHIIYSFGKLVGNTVQKLEYNDFQLYSQINDLKQQNPSLRTLLAMGGWTAGSVVYSDMVKTSGSRKEFIESAIVYLRDWNFDGLDMDWEYPATRGGAPEDKVNFGLLVKELREAFDLETNGTGLDRLLLTAAVAAGKGTIDLAYDVPTMARYMDFINIMTYDLHGSWEATTGHNSPLFPRSDEYWYQRQLNIEFSANYWHNIGVPKDKLIIGLATYGRTFTLSSSQTGLGAPARGAGIAGEFTKESGFMSYYEICALQESGIGWTVYDSEQMVPYYTDGSFWVGFDDEISIGIKVEWLVSEGYGGAMVWALDLDDFRQTCGKSKRRYPLINTIKDGLLTAGNGGLLTTPVLPTGKSSAAPPTATTLTTLSSTKSGGTGSDFSCVGKVDGFYTDNNDCTRFYICENERDFHMNCPSGLLYNSKKMYCDYPENVVCITTSTSHTTQPSSTESTSREVTSSILTDTIPSSSKSTSPEEISSTFTTTLSSSTKSTSSEETSSTLTTTLPSSTKSTSQEEAPSSFTTTQPSSSTSTSPTESSSTFTTTQSSSTPSNSPTETSPTTSSVLPRVFCLSKADGLYPHPTICNKYYQCYNAGAVLWTCPQGLNWNPNRKVCDWPNNVDCFSSVDTSTTISTTILTTKALTSPTVTTTVPQTSTTLKTTLSASAPTISPSSTTTLNPVPSDFCVGKIVGDYAHPTSCSEYITCVGIAKFIRRCPGDLLWNVATGNCDWKNYVDCTV